MVEWEVKLSAELGNSLLFEKYLVVLEHLEVKLVSIELELRLIYRETWPHEIEERETLSV